jgi:ribosomal protein L16/L10AE
LRYKKLNIIEQVSQKKRLKFKSKKSKLVWGNVGIITFKNCRFENVYFTIIKKYLKSMIRLKYSSINFFKIWIFLTFNYPIRQKSKNSRMGKGIGAFVRWSTKLIRGFTIIEFKNIHFARLSILQKKWKYYLNFPIIIIKK